MQFRQLRELVIDAVLATDLQTHFDNVGKLKLKASASALSSGWLDFGEVWRRGRRWWIVLC